MAFSNFSTNKVLNGTEGRVKVDGEIVCAVQSCSAELSMSYDDLNVNGNYVTQHRYVSCSVSGSISVHKHDSWLLSTVAMTPTTGIVPSVTIEMSIRDPQTNQTQLVALYDCQFEQVNLGNFENASLQSEDWSFSAGGYEIVSTIN